MTRKLILAAALLAMLLPSTAAHPQEERPGLRGRIEQRVDKWRHGPLVRQLRAALVKERQEHRRTRDALRFEISERDRLNRELAEERARPRPECPAPVPLPPNPPLRSKG